MIHRFAILFALVLSVGGLALAQEGGPSVSVVSIAPVTVAPGHTAQATMLFRVNGGYHINSHKPNDELLIPTEVKFDLPTEIMVQKVTYPEGQSLTLPFSPDAPLSVYSGDFKVLAAIRPALNSPPGTFRVHGELKYQACSDRQCFPPKKMPIQFDVKVTKPGKSHKK